MPGIPIDPSKLLKAAAPLISFVRSQVALQDADLAPIRLSGVDKEIDQALGVLSLDAQTGSQALLQYVKGKIADRPEVFDEEPVPQWLATERTRELLRKAVYAYIGGRSVQAFADEAAAFFAQFDGADGPGRGYAAFEYALPFALLTIANSLDVGDRLILAAVGDVGDRLSAATTPLPRELLDGEVVRELDCLRRRRFFGEVDSPTDARRLAARVNGGDLSGASGTLRATALAVSARYLASEAGGAEARRLIDGAAVIADVEETVIAKAALAAVCDVDAALATLAPIDSPARRLAALGILARQRTPGELLDWADAAGIAATDLDSDGRHVLLLARVEDARWEDAHIDAVTVSQEDLVRTPALAHGVTVARIAWVTPPDLRHVVAMGTPFDPVGFPLADGAEAVAERRLAAEIARKGVEAMREAGASEAAGFLESMSMWLDLRDPAQRAGATAGLGRLLDGSDGIRWIPLATAFKVVTDLGPVERAVQRAATLDPRGSATIAVARLALAMAQPTPSEAADYLSRHRAAIEGHLDPTEIAQLEIDMLICAGRTSDAGTRLDAVEDMVDRAKAERFRKRIDGGGTGLTLTQLETAYTADPSTTNLAQLVGELAKQGYSDRFNELARLLVAATRTVATAEGVLRVLQRAGKWDELATLLAEIPDLVDQSPVLTGAYAWDAYRRGDLRTAEEALPKLQAAGDDASTRSLRHNILLVSGRWRDIARIVEDEWTRRSDRSAPELLELAQLARQVGSVRVRDLIELAVSKGAADPNVLARAYVMSTQAGLESDEVHGWLETAAALSGDDGPIQRADLADLVAEQPDWDQRTADIWSQVRAGILPLYIAAALLRRPGLELRLGAMLGNQRETDPRRRSAVPAFSGLRGGTARGAATLGLDGSSLITLGVLGLVGTVVARGPISIPHSTLGWLFQERQKLAFHQPSRVAFAHRLQRELGSGRMVRFSPSAAVDGRLSDTIGRSLAAMIASAEAAPERGAQRLVVRSAPVQRVGTFRGETVDLASHGSVLCSCQSVVDALEARGQIDAAEARHARTYLQASEQRWPSEPEIKDGAELYLDDLTVSLLDTAGVLGRMHAGGFRVHLPHHSVEEANALIDLEARSAEMEKVVEHIRFSLAAGIAGGTVTLFPLANEREELQQHPDLRVIDMAGYVDAIVSDDRAINRVRQIDGATGSSPTWTSLDVLAQLRSEDLISEDELTAHRTTLRRSGLVLFPTDREELSVLIGRAGVRDGQMVETAELRALRENLQLALMRRFLKLPDEAGYLQALSRAAVQSILRQWTDAIPDDVARARCRWLMARADMRDWVAMIEEGSGGGLALHGLAIPITTLLGLHLEVVRSARPRFGAWLVEDVLAPMKEDEPEAHAWLLEQIRAEILEVGTGGDDE